MKIFGLLLIILGLGSPSLAATKSPYHFVFAYGSEYRPERDVENNFAQHFYSNYAIGVGKDRITLLLEKADFSETSGNATLNLKRTSQDYLLWGQYSVYSQGLVNAYGGVSVGAYQESVTTHFQGQSTQNSAKYKFMTALALGGRLNVSVFFASIEARVLFGDELSGQPLFGGLLRGGVWF